MDVARATLSGLARVGTHPTRRFNIRFGSFTEVMSMLAVAIGGGALVGWAADNVALKSLYPGLVTMKPNDAIGLILTGVTLWMLRREPVPVPDEGSRCSALSVPP